MCRMCGDDDCKDGKECHLAEYIYRPNIRDAILRVQAFDNGFVSNGFGTQQYALHPSGGTRPALAPGVQEHFRDLGDKGFSCPYCDRRLAGGSNIDHVIPWLTYIQRMLGLGPDADLVIPMFVARVLASDPDNLQLTCENCNKSKKRKTRDGPEFDDWKARRQEWGRRQAKP